jgi:hypothetical protein
MRALGEMRAAHQRVETGAQRRAGMLATFAVCRIRQDGQPAEVQRFTYPVEAEIAAALVREIGDSTAHVEIVLPDELERELAQR